MAKNNAPSYQAISDLKLTPDNTESTNKNKDENKPQAKPQVKQSINVSGDEPVMEYTVQGNPENMKDLTDKDTYKVTVMKSGLKVVTKIAQELKEEKKDENKDEKDLNNKNNDKLNQPLLLKPGFSIKNRVKQVNNNTVNSWKNNPAYLGMTEEAKSKVEDDKNMQKMFRYVAFSDMKGLDELIETGKIKPEALNAYDGLAVRIVISTGNVEMAQHLFAHGASPHGIDPRSCYSPEMAQLVKDEQYRQNNPIVSTLRESFGMGLPTNKPKYN